MRACEFTTIRFELLLVCLDVYTIMLIMFKDTFIFNVKLRGRFT